MKHKAKAKKDEHKDKTPGKDMIPAKSKMMKDGMRDEAKKARKK